MTATCSAGKRSGGTCGRPAGWGTPHAGYGSCKLHAGSTGPHLVHAERLRIADEEKRIAAEYGFGREVNIPDALLEALYAAAGRLDFWNGKVRQLDGLTERGVGGSSDVHHYVRAAERVERDYARVAGDCARLGIEARRAAVNQQEAERLVRVLLDAVEQLGADPNDPRVRAALATALRRADQLKEVDR